MEPIETAIEPQMCRRKILLEDGRYLLFYTFDTGSDAEQKQAEEGENRSET